MAFWQSVGFGRPMHLSWRRSNLIKIVLLASMALMARVPLGAGGAEPVVEPRYEWEVMTGVLWKVGSAATPLSYRLIPQIISLKIPPLVERPLASGTFVLRSRFSLLLEPIHYGPENFYLGVAAAGEIEWRPTASRFEVFFAAGGGFGWMDSKGYEIAGGQGQNFNLNWLVHSGVRYRTTSGWRCSAGIYFQHISNRRMDKINPGLNAVGPMVGVSRRF